MCENDGTNDEFGFEHITDLNSIQSVENIRIRIEKLAKPINERSSSKPAGPNFYHIKHVVVIGHCPINVDSNLAVEDAFERLAKECENNLYAFDVKTNLQITFQGYHVILSASIYKDTILHL